MIQTASIGNRRARRLSRWRDADRCLELDRLDLYEADGGGLEGQVQVAEFRAFADGSSASTLRSSTNGT